MKKNQSLDQDEKIKKMILDIIAEVDYDIWKDFQEDTSEDYEASQERMLDLIQVAKKHLPSIQPCTKTPADQDRG